MDIKHLITNLEKRTEKKGISLHIGKPVSEKKLDEFETSIRKSIPYQIKLFYRNFNGLKVDEPKLEIKPIDDLNMDDNGKIVFAIFDEKHKICFNTNSINEASQWDILNYDSGYLVTITMASFWSNKIFAWLDKQRAIWEEETF